MKKLILTIFILFLSFKVYAGSTFDRRYITPGEPNVNVHQAGGEYTVGRSTFDYDVRISTFGVTLPDETIFKSTTQYLGINVKAADSDLLDGKNYDAFLSTSGDTMSGNLNMGENYIVDVSTIQTYGKNIIISPASYHNNYDFAIAIGSNVYNNYTYGIGIGKNTYNNHSYGLGIGCSSMNNYSHGIGIGYSAYNNYAYGVGIGDNAYNNDNFGIGIGKTASHNYLYGVGIGPFASYNNNYGVGIGAYVQNVSDHGVAIGAYSYANSTAVALGYNAQAKVNCSVAIGAGCINNSTGTVRIADDYDLVMGTNGAIIPCSLTEVELKTLIPSSIGGMYFDSTNVAIVLSTGTLVGQFGRIYDGSLKPVGW